MDFQKLIQNIKNFFSRVFDIRQEKENEQETILAIKKDVDFNLWVLIFAIFIASLGLNTNSTAVIIGAMLISPLMGPIMGFGLGLGIYDFELIKQSARTFALATLFSIITSTCYFFISPISEAQSELLARTQPTLYDVLIAFFGGLAGIVACSTKSKGNVIPGVAIATALMPPLCTAGFGLATGNFYYFFGAFYLYIINSVFISLATFMVVRLLKYPKKEQVNKDRQKKVTRYVGILVILTIVPSLFLSYKLVRTTYFNQRALEFINNELAFPNTQVLSKAITNTSEKQEIKVMLIGKNVPEESIENARIRLERYRLKNVNLIVQQGFSEQETDINEIKSVLIQDLYKNKEEILRAQSLEIDSLKQQLKTFKEDQKIAEFLRPEVKVLFPFVKEISCSQTYLIPIDSIEQKAVVLFYVKSSKKVNKENKQKLTDWLKARIQTKTIKLLIEND